MPVSDGYYGGGYAPAPTVYVAPPAIVVRPTYYGYYGYYRGGRGGYRYH